MVNQQLIDYIKKEFGRGVSEDRVRLNLFKKKWSEPEIESSLKIAKRELKKERKKEKKKKEIALLKKELEQLKKQVAERTQKKEKKKHKNPLIALFLSFILAGLGQFYNGQILRGFFFLIGYSLGTGLSFYFDSLYSEYYLFTLQKGALLLMGLSAMSFTITSMIDAYKGAKEINKKKEENV